MRLLIATPLYPPDLEALAIYTKELATRLAQDHTVRLVTYGTIPETIRNVEITAVSKQLPIAVRLVKYTLELWKQSADLDFLYVADGASVGLPALLIGKLRSIPVIRFFLDDEARVRAERDLYVGIPEETFAALRELDLKTRSIRRLQNWIIGRAAKTLVPSSYLKAILTNAYRLPAHKLIVSAFPVEKAHMLSFSEERRSKQIFVQTPLNFFSGVEDALQAIDRLRAQHPDIQLIIADTGAELPQLKERVKELGLEAHVQFIGRISRAEFWFLLQTSTIYLQPRTSANTAEDIYQAYSAQIPVVASAIDCHAEALQSGKSGILVPPGDNQKLTDVLNTLLTHEDERQAFVQGGEQALQMRGGWEEHAKQIISIL